MQLGLEPSCVSTRVPEPEKKPAQLAFVLVLGQRANRTVYFRDETLTIICRFQHKSALEHRLCPRHTSRSSALRMAETLPLVATALGDLRIPREPHGIVMIAGGSDASGVVRDILNEAHFATLQLNGKHAGHSPSSAVEVRERTQRLLEAAELLAGYPELAGLPAGIFGSARAGGAALAAAAERPEMFRALVLRDGEPQVTGRILDAVRAATLLIVDGQDNLSIALNQEMMTRVNGIAELEILAGAPGTYEDPRTVAQVAQLARRWFDRFLS